MSMEPLERMPVTKEDLEATDPDLVRVEWLIDHYWRCPDCHRPLRLKLRFYDPPRPFDDTLEAMCVVCDGVWASWGRDIASDRTALQNDMYLRMLGAWLGPRHLWLSPFIN
jgi:hypothetical protein